MRNIEKVKELEALIKQYNKHPRKNIRKQDIVSQFQQLQILIPCRNDGKELFIHDETFEGAIVKPDVVKDHTGVRLLPVFTTYEQIPIEYMDKFSLLRIEARHAYDFMNESEEIRGIVINPFTNLNFAIRKKKISVNATQNYVKSLSNHSEDTNLGATIIYHNQKYSVLKSPFIIGRQEGDINLEKTYISKIHAIIAYKNGQYRIADYESKNGTVLDGKILKPKIYYPLGNGSEIMLANRERLIFYEPKHN